MSESTAEIAVMHKKVGYDTAIKEVSLNLSFLEKEPSDSFDNKNEDDEYLYTKNILRAG